MCISCGKDDYSHIADKETELHAQHMVQMVTKETNAHALRIYTSL